MSAIKNVAVSGASGDIGLAIVNALLAADFKVTAITRSGSSRSFPDGVQVTEVDYSSLDSLKSALKDQDAVISTVGFAGMQAQELLVDAAIATGVKRIIPSEFGRDPDNARIRSLPVFTHKVQIEDYIKAKVPGTQTTYSLVCNNEFFDWDLDNKIGVDIKGKKMEIFDDGEHVYSCAPLDFAARGVVGVLQHPDETANRVVRLHGASMTQNKFLAMLQKYTGKDGWDTPHVSIKERERQAYEMLQNDPGNMFAWAIAFLHCAVYGEEFGNDYSKNNDNALLGLEELTDGELEEIVRSRA